MAPRVTVLMAVYNGGHYLVETIESILQQTFRNFEFLIVDDGSTDSTWQILSSYAAQDERFVLVRSPQNLGRPAARNIGLEQAHGDYIALMDADDIALPKRLECQVAFLDKHPDIDVCGSWVFVMGGSETIWRYPTQHDEIRCQMLLRNPIANPSVIMRKKKLADHCLRYNLDYRVAQEDYELWVRCSQSLRYATLPQPLLAYRLRTTQTISEEINVELQRLVRDIWGLHWSALGLQPDSFQIDIHETLAAGRYWQTTEQLTETERWLVTLREANYKTHAFPEPAFDRMLGGLWLRCCIATFGLRPAALSYFRSSVLHRLVGPKDFIGLAWRQRYRIRLKQHRFELPATTKVRPGNKH